MAIRVQVPKVEIPAQENALDGVADALVRAWNEQGKDQTARAFFGLSTTGERQEMIVESILRYSDADREFVAFQLVALADAIYGGCSHWTSKW